MIVLHKQMKNKINEQLDELNKIDIYFWSII